MTYKIHYSIYAAVFTYNIRKNITHTKQNVITYCCKYEIFLLLLLSSFLSECGCRCRLLTELDSLFSVFFMSLVVARSIRHLADVSAGAAASSAAALSLYLRLAFVYVFHSLSMYVSCFSVHVHMYASSVWVFVCACLYVCTFTWPTRTHKLCQQRAQVRRACFKIARNFL